MKIKKTTMYALMEEWDCGCEYAESREIPSWYDRVRVIIAVPTDEEIKQWKKEIHEEERAEKEREEREDFERFGRMSVQEMVSHLAAEKENQDSARRCLRMMLLPHRREETPNRTIRYDEYSRHVLSFLGNEDRNKPFWERREE